MGLSWVSGVRAWVAQGGYLVYFVSSPKKFKVESNNDGGSPKSSGGTLNPCRKPFRWEGNVG
jgi:hypothetical protein